jgi:hypothetical protein
LKKFNPFLIDHIPFHFESHQYQTAEKCLTDYRTPAVLAGLRESILLVAGLPNCPFFNSELFIPKMFSLSGWINLVLTKLQINTASETRVRVITQFLPPLKIVFHQFWN